jgi:chromosomal replication initiator protein
MIIPGLIMNIDDAVSHVWGIEKNMLYIKTRKRGIVEPRQVAMWWRRINTTDSLAGIGKIYGNVEHSTVFHSCKTVEDLLKNNCQFRNMVEQVLKFISPKKQDNDKK